MSTPDNPPAFPQAHPSISVHDGKSARHLLGMTLRDWFAGQALGGMFANHPIYPDPKIFQIHAKQAYMAADAMLAARTQQDAAATGEGQP